MPPKKRSSRKRSPSGEGVEVIDATQGDFENPNGKILPMHPGNARKRASTKRQLNDKERLLKAINMKLLGSSYDEIAAECGYTTAKGAYEAVRRQIHAIPFDSGNELRRVQYARLNNMLLTIQPQVLVGDLEAIREARMLMKDMNELMNIGAGDGAEELGSEGGDTLIIINGAEPEYIRQLQVLTGDVPSDAIPASVVEVPTTQDGSHGTEEG